MCFSAFLIALLIVGRVMQKGFLESQFQKGLIALFKAGFVFLLGCAGLLDSLYMGFI